MVRTLSPTQRVEMISVGRDWISATTPGVAPLQKQEPSGPQA